MGVFGQVISENKSFFEPTDSFNQTRFFSALGFTTAVYSGFSIALYHTWYKEFEQESFHFFNDWNEWKNMDKQGHVYSAYFQTALSYKGAKWTGLSENSSILTGALCGGLFQTTIEIMDGYSSKWGFSWTDFGANIVGIGSFVAQQRWWGNQKLLIKQSVGFRDHPKTPIQASMGDGTTTLFDRSRDLFGSSSTARYLKDYNNQTYWLSFSPASFNEQTSWPSWLNVALGFGVENLYGGFENRWEENGAIFELDKDLYPRYRQFYLGLDIDLTKVKTQSPFLKSVLSVLNIVKIPSPALEITSHGEVVFHFLYL
jgi:hypothetical protein